MKNICIIGAGSWGTALALTAHRVSGQQVTLVTRNPKDASTLKTTHENRTYLPGIKLPDELAFTHDLNILKDADIVLQVTPAQTIQETCVLVKEYLSPKAAWVICSKGIAVGKDHDKSRLLSEISQEILSNPIAILSGPSFAEEVALNMPTAVTIASYHEETAKLIASCLRHKYFRCYINDDPIGVQVAGAVKNILAIACGIVRGKGFGNNATAALITRGLTEMRRLGMAMGGKSDTFLGLSAVGDVTLTCSSEQSRNMRLGIALGKKGANIAQLLQDSPFIAEGFPTAAAVHKLSKDLSIPMPLCEAVYTILYNHLPIDEVIETILSRQTELEF